MTREMQVYRNALISTLIRKESDEYLAKLYEKHLAEIYNDIQEEHYTNEDLVKLNEINEKYQAS